MRQPYSGYNGHHGQPASTGYGVAGQNPERLNNLKRAVDAIEQRIATAQPAAPYAPQQFAPAPSYAPQPAAYAPQPQGDLSILQEQIDRLSSQIAHTNVAAYGHAGPAPMVQAYPEYAPIPTAPAAPTYLENPATQDLQAIAAELQKRQRALDDSARLQAEAQERADAQARAEAKAHADAQAKAAADAKAQMAALQASVPQMPTSMSVDRQTTAKLDAISKVMASLQSELAGLKKQVANPKPAVATQAEIDRIAKAIGNLQGAANVDDRVFEKLHKDIEELRTGMNEDVRRTVRREIATSNGNQANDMTRRFDERIEALSESLNGLAQNFDTAALENANTVVPRVDSLANQLDALRVTVDDLPQTLAISRLEDQLGDVVSKMEKLSASNSEMMAENSRLTETFVGREVSMSPDDLSSIEGRLDEVARALVAVSNSASKATPAAAPAPEIDLSGIERVEARISELGRAVDEIYQRDSSEDLNKIAVRIDGLTERLGSFEKYAEQGDLGAANAMFAAPDIGVIEEQLRQLNARVDGSLNAAPTQHLEEQLAHLSARVEEAATTNSTAAQMSNLEAQIGQIIRHLNKSGSAPEAVAAPVDFSPVEARLGQIENQLASSQNFSLEAAQQAAQQAVAMMGSSSEAGQIIDALSQDLRSLQEMAETGNAQNAQTVQNLESTLSQVVERLASIEGSIANPQPAVMQAAAAPQAAYAHPANQSYDQTAFAADGMMDTAGTMQVEAPSLDPSYDLENAGAAPHPQMDPATAMGFAPPPMPGAPEDDSPLEPGTAPNLQAMVDQAGQRLQADQDPYAASHVDGMVPPVDGVDPMNPGDEMRPDAVAAARRALQATTDEMNAVKDEAKSTSKLGSVGGKLGGKLPKFDMSRMRKPLVMGAAALLLAVIAFKGAGLFFDDGKKSVAKNKAKKPKVEMSAAAPKMPGKKDGAKKNETKVVTAKNAPKSVDAGKIAGGVAGATASGETVVAAPPPRVVGAEKAEETAAPKKMDMADAKAPAVSTGEPDKIAGAETPGKPVQPVQKASVEPTAETAPDTTGKIAVPSSAGSRALVAAASTGDPKALFQIGMRYSEGTDVKRNMTEAAKWLTLAAEKGFAPAQYSIGSLYEKGIGVARDVKVAAGWYDKAAAQGNARAMHNLAVIHAMGNPPEVQPNMEKAVGWFQKAATYGIKDSQFNLGILYGQGMGVPQNLGESYKWFALAAKTGDSDASSKRDEVANAMDPDDLDTARKEVNNWIPQKLNEPANRVAVPKAWQGRGTPERSASASTSGRETVKKTQAMLNQRGFKVGTPDGLMGPKTKRAIMEFQRSAGLPVTGKVDSKLMNALAI